MNRTHESGRSNGNKLVSTLTVAGIGITALTSCAADQEPEAPIQTEVESTFVTEIPITPSPVVTETPAPLPIQTAESDPVNIPQPSTSESLTNSSEYVLKAERFDMTVEEYEALVNSYKIPLEENTSPEKIADAVTEKINLFYSAGLNENDFNKYSEWKDPNGEVKSGWNSWSTSVHSEAFQDALGIADGFETMKDNKSLIAGLWISSKEAGDPGYQMTIDYTVTSWTPYKNSEGQDSYGIVGTYSSTGNSDLNPSIKDHKRLPQNSSIEGVGFDVTPFDGELRLNAII